MKNLGGNLAGAPSACTSADNSVDVFAVAPGGAVWHWSGDGSNWTPPVMLPNAGTIPAEGLCAISSGAGHVELFAIPAGGHAPIWWRGNGPRWTIGPPLPAGPTIPTVPVAAIALSPNDIDVFAVATDRNVWWWHWNGAGWLAPIPLLPGANLPAERIAAVSPSPGTLDVFGVGANTHLWHWRKIGAAPWLAEDLGGNLPSAGVSAVSWGPGRIDVFAASRLAGAQLQHWWSDGARFAGPESLRGDPATGSVSAVSSAINRLDVFAIITGGHIAHWQWDGHLWNGPNLRGESVPAGDISAVVRKPHRLDLFVTGTGNTLRKWPGGGLENATMQPWVNWPTNRQKNPVDGHLRPDNLEELSNIVKQAEQLGRGIRAVGSSWSNSDVAVTPSYVIETDGLSAILTDVLTTSLNASGAARRLIHVEAGIKLFALIDLLDARGLALGTLGGSTGQSLAGAISTSVHGMDIDRGPLPDIIRAIHLVGPGGVQHWIEPASATITNREPLKLALGLADENIHYDDDWFYSVLVSMGSLGIIYSAIVEVDLQYDLIEKRRALDWVTMKTRLRGRRGVPDDPFVNRGVQIAINPYPAGDGSHKCHLTTRTQGPATAPFNGPNLSSLVAVFTPALLAGFRIDRSTVDDTVNLLTDQQQADADNRGWGHSISGGSDPGLVKGLTVEMIFDATNTRYIDFVDAALETIRKAYYDEAGSPAYLGWISMRFQGRSKAYLSPQSNSDRTCTVECAALWRMDNLPGVGWAETPVLLARIEAKGREFGGIQHWGMNDAMDGNDVERTYPKINKWRQVRWQLTKNGTLATFDNDFTRRCRLSIPPV